MGTEMNVVVPLHWKKKMVWTQENGMMMSKHTIMTSTVKLIMNDGL
jgi:hypothetical protein